MCIGKSDRKSFVNASSRSPEQFSSRRRCTPVYPQVADLFSKKQSTGAANESAPAIETEYVSIGEVTEPKKNEESLKSEADCLECLIQFELRTQFSCE
jgi:hypothetical protein